MCKLIMKKFLKYASIIAMGLISVFWGIKTVIAFKLDVLHDFNKDHYYCLIPHYDYCILIFVILLALLYILLYITYDW